jgi:hypothetical protein
MLELLGFLLSPIGLIVVGYLVYAERKAGRLTLPLKDNDFLVDKIVGYIDGKKIEAVNEWASMSQVARSPSREDYGGGLSWYKTNWYASNVNEYEFERYLQDVLKEHNFPHSKIHDLRKAVCQRISQKNYKFVQDIGLGDSISNAIKKCFDQYEHAYQMQKRLHELSK